MPFILVPALDSKSFWEEELDMDTTGKAQGGKEVQRPGPGTGQDFPGL